MMNEILTRMTGQELLLLRILNGDGIALSIEAELDRRATLAPAAARSARTYGAARAHAMRRSAAVVSAA